MNKYQTDLDDCDYVRVDGIVARAYGEDDLRFVIPKPSDYPGMDYIAGIDFIFVFESISDQTWYKEVDLEKGEFRSSLFYIGYKLRVKGLDEESKYAVNINKTAFCLPFVMDEESLDMRLLNPDIEIDSEEDISSCEIIYMQILGDIPNRVDQFIGHLLSLEDTSVKPIPNPEFKESFGIGFSEKNPVFLGQIRHAYMLGILISQREHRFPYGLKFEQFKKIVEL